MISFVVHGLAAPQGSKRAFVNKFTKKAQMVENNSERLRPWRSDVAAAARVAVLKEDWHRGQAGPLYPEGPVKLAVVFHFPRPKSHYIGGKVGKGLRADAPEHVAKKPDASKVLRAVEDAMTGIVYHDDAQIADLRVIKLYTEREPRAEIVVSSIPWRGAARVGAAR